MELTKENFEFLYFKEFKTIKEVGYIFGMTEGGARYWKNKWRISTHNKYQSPHLKIYSIPLNENEKSLIVGSLLGDGCITQRAKNNDCWFQIGHSVKQLEYLKWKSNSLNNLVKSKISFYTNSAFGTIVKAARLQSICHPELAIMRKLWYPERTKIITYNNVFALDDLGLAIWYMDDGNKGKSDNITLYTCSFTLEENNILKRVLLDNFNIIANIRMHKKKYPVLFIDKRNSKIMFDRVRPLVEQIPCMKYKLP